MKLSDWKTLPLDSHDRKPWHPLSPQETRDLYKTCGEKCFLLTPLTSDETKIQKNPKKYLKFPICRPPHQNQKKTTCAISTSGVLAARRRAILTRSKVGSKYDLVEKDTSQYIQRHSLTLASKKDWPIQRIILLSKPQFGVTVIYQNGQHDTRYSVSPQTVLRLYRPFLSPIQYNKLRLLKK